MDRYVYIYIYIERERERERERQTDRQRETETDRDRERQRERERGHVNDREIRKQMRWSLTGNSTIHYSARMFLFLRARLALDHKLRDLKIFDGQKVKKPTDVLLWLSSHFSHGQPILGFQRDSGYAQVNWGYEAKYLGYGLWWTVCVSKIEESQRWTNTHDFFLTYCYSFYKIEVWNPWKMMISMHSTLNISFCTLKVSRLWRMMLSILFTSWRSNNLEVLINRNSIFPMVLFGSMIS